MSSAISSSVARWIAVACVAGCILVLAGCLGGDDSDVARQSPDSREPQSRVKGEQESGTNRDRARGPSVWLRQVTGSRPLDRRSPALVRSLSRVIDTSSAQGRPAWIGISRCAERIYTVGKDQKTVPVKLSDAHLGYKRSLQAAFRKVPIPDGAEPADCPDSSLVIRQPSRNRMWDFWHARHDGSGWRADWGGATRRAAQNPGSYNPSDWPGARYDWGASASSMTLDNGAITQSEIKRGSIDHAMTLALPEVARGVWAWPAQRSDGKSTAADAIPYGARFRLASGLDVDALRAPRATKIIAKAAQRYGFVVRERTGYGVQLSAEAGPVGRPNQWPQVLGASPGTVMQAFPWSHLQVLRMDLRTQEGGPRR